MRGAGREGERLGDGRGFQHAEVAAFYNAVQRELGGQPPFHQDQFFLASRYPIEAAQVAFADQRSAQRIGATIRPQEWSPIRGVP